MQGLGRGPRSWHSPAAGHPSPYGTPPSGPTVAVGADVSGRRQVFHRYDGQLGTLSAIKGYGKVASADLPPTSTGTQTPPQLPSSNCPPPGPHLMYKPFELLPPVRRPGRALLAPHLRRRLNLALDEQWKYNGASNEQSQVSRKSH